VLNIAVDKTKARFKTDGKTILLIIYGKVYSVGSEKESIDLPDFYIAKYTENILKTKLNKKI
jgi:hypothetical protein